MTKRTAKKYANLMWVESLNKGTLPLKVEKGLYGFAHCRPRRRGKPNEAAIWFRELADALEQE